MAGAIWAEAAWGRYWGWDPKETWSFITWVIYAAYLHSRATAGWKGKRAAYFAVAAFGALIINYYVVNTFIVGLHSYAGRQVAGALNEPGRADCRCGRLSRSARLRRPSRSRPTSCAASRPRSIRTSRSARSCSASCAPEGPALLFENVRGSRPAAGAEPFRQRAADGDGPRGRAARRHRRPDRGPAQARAAGGFRRAAGGFRQARRAAFRAAEDRGRRFVPGGRPQGRRGRPRAAAGHPGLA